MGYWWLRGFSGHAGVLQANRAKSQPRSALRFLISSVGVFLRLFLFASPLFFLAFIHLCFLASLLILVVLPASAKLQLPHSTERK